MHIKNKDLKIYYPRLYILYLQNYFTTLLFKAPHIKCKKIDYAAQLAI